MAKQYYIVNKNEIQNSLSDSNIFYTLLLLLCIIATMIFICNYFFNYKINITTILILLVIIILCKNIID
jgi:hypothetical protein